LIEEPKSPWFKVSKGRFKKICAYSKFTGFIERMLKDVAMTSKRAKKNKIFGRMNSLATPLERLNNLKKMYILTPMKNFIHVMMFLYLLHRAYKWFQETQQSK
jgi:hypothetical protein